MATPFEIPVEMRDFAERSVEQARKAFEGFMGAAHKAAGTVDGATSKVQVNAREMGAQAVAFTEKSVAEAFELAQKLIRAKDIQEVLSLQAEYARKQVAAVQEQAKDIGSKIQQAAAPKAD